jgi:thioredoxin 1
VRDASSFEIARSSGFGGDGGMNTAGPWTDEIGFIPHQRGQPEAINADSFDDDVLESPVPVIVEFWAARCGPCRRLAPEMAAAAAALGGRARVFTLNVDEELDAALRFGVHAVPATLLFVNGEERGRIVGFAGRASLVNLLRPHLDATIDPETET